MKAITLHQPWASLIAAQIKLTETRAWPAPDSLIGQRIAIHAAKRAARFTEWNKGTSLMSLSLPMPLGAVVATARIDGCSRVLSRGYHPIIGAEADPGKVWVLDRYADESKDTRQLDTDPHGDYSELRWIWRLSDIKTLENPVGVRGFQTIWTLPDDTAESVLAQEKAAGKIQAAAG